MILHNPFPIQAAITFSPMERCGRYYVSSILLLSLACLITYCPIFFNQFQLQWDDQWVVLNAYTANGIQKQNLWRVLKEYYHGQYAPLNEFYYILLKAVFGYNAVWFHTGSFCIHLANVLLVYHFVNKLISLCNDLNVAASQRIAFLTSLLLATHPFLVEAVAWVSASKNILYAFFYLAALIFYLEYLASHKFYNLLLTMLLFIVSFGAKEQAVTLPCCLLLIDFTLKRNLKQRRIWIEKLPFFCLSVFFGFITMYSQAADGEGILSQEISYPFYQRLVFACYALTEYFVKCLIPIKLSYLYPFPSQVGEVIPFRFWIYPFVLLFATSFFCSFWKQRWIFFGIGFFIVHIGLVLHIIPLSRYAIVADRYAYIASVGVFFIIAFLVNKAIAKNARKRKLYAFVAVIYVLCLAVYAHERCKVWYDTCSLKKELLYLLKQRNDYQIRQNPIK